MYYILEFKSWMRDRHYFDWPEVKYFSSKSCAAGVRIICKDRIEKALSVLSLYIKF